MEHELFQSKLKPSIDGALVSDIIQSSSSGLNSYRAVAMELIIERSIQERRKRMVTKAKNHLRSDPTSQPKSEVPNTPIPQLRSPTPTTASQPPFRSLPNDTTESIASRASASFNQEAQQEPLPPSETVKKVALREEPFADVNINSSPSEDFVELVCLKCSVKQLRSGLQYGIDCGLCPFSWVSTMKCVGCGTIRKRNTEACSSCHKKFK